MRIMDVIENKNAKTGHGNSGNDLSGEIISPQLFGAGILESESVETS